MTTSEQEERKLRREVFENDRKVREQQSATMLDHARSTADDDRGGRYANVEGKHHVVGSTPVPRYPQLPSGPWSGVQPEPGPEPPLGFAIDQQEPATGRFLPVATGPASPAALSPLMEGDQQRSDVGPSSSTKGETDGA